MTDTKLLSKYETLLVCHADATEAETDKIWKRIDSITSRQDGHEIRREFWRRRRLAYPIRKQKKGVYHYMLYLAGNQMVGELESDLRITDKVLRFINVKLDDGVTAGDYDFDAEKG